MPIHYSPGKTYKYSYTTDTLLNEAASTKATPARKDVGFSVSTQVELNPVWHQNEDMLVRMVVSKETFLLNTSIYDITKKKKVKLMLVSHK